MAKPGPAPLPTHLKVVKGVRADRINTKEPKPTEAKSTCPSWLSSDAKKVWKRVSTELAKMGILAAADQDLLAAYCNAVVLYQKASLIVDTQGPVIEGRRDGIVKNPAVQIQRDAAELMRKLAAEFGLSPSSRSRIALGGPEDDSLDSLLE